MDNLKLMKVRSLPIDDIKGQIIYVSVGEERKKKEVYYLKNDTVICVDLSEGEELILGTEIKDVIRAEYMSTHNKITISTGKSIMIIDCDSKDFYKRDFDKKVKQIGWNNTYDYLATVFEDGSISTFVFDVRCELMRQGEGSLYTVVPRREDVGWGSITTQFQGPVKHDELQPTGLHMAPIDDLKPVVSWRGNNDEFVISYLDGCVRQFKVFDHLCLPKAKSELLSGKMYGPIAWKPQGNIIAAAIFLDQQNYIGLFEKNGLFRMLFSLVDIHFPITFLSWSSCGKVLNVTHEDNKGQMHICLYTTSNTRWYLKQHLVFSKSNPLCTLTWATTSPQCVELLAVTKNEVIQYKYRFQFDVDHRNNLIAAIDGKTLLIHGFRESVDPAPICTDKIVLDNPINMIAFHPYKDLAAALDSVNILYCFSISGIQLNIVIQLFLLRPVFPLNINHLFWKGDNPQVLVENTQECYSYLHEVDRNARNLVKMCQFDVTLFAVEHIYAIDNVTITHDGKYRTIYKLKENPATTPNLPYPLQVIPLKYGCEIFCLMLTPEQEFYVEEEVVCKGITSMIVHKDFLLLTDNTMLYTLKLNRHSVETLAVDGLSEFHSRPLNESAILVCMVHDTPNVVLHTPRGNLEIVSCRSMEVRIVEEKLSQKEWSEAIRFMRLARMNWNLLIDSNAGRFYDNLAEIVAECNSQNVLNSIVAEISDENCLTTIYKKAIEVIPYTPLKKRNIFLNKLGAYLDQSGSFSEYLPTVLKICVDQNNLEKAMNYASSLLANDTEEDKQKVDRAIALLRLQVDADDLFKAALKIFDVKLADFVAKKCQMNPQEVDPVLNELKILDDLQKRIAIHLRFQNWDETVAYMLRKEDPNKDEILDFIQKHGVAKRAYLESLKLKIPFKPDIAQLYVQKLISQKCHNEAAVILVQYLFYNEAVVQFKLALDYQKCVEYLPLATSFSDDDKQQLFTELAEKLVAADRISEAAHVYEDHIGDHVTAVKTLAQGRLFMHALRLARKYSFNDLIDMLILPNMLTSLTTIMGRVDETGEAFKKNIDRLKRLRNIKKYNYEQIKKRSHDHDGSSTPTSSASFLSRRLRTLERERIAEFDHYFVQDSDVQSVISLGSRKSSRSSSSSTITQKHVRKMEKQKQDTTEGSRFEDIALMRELHIMISMIFKFGPEVRELFLRLIEYSVIDLNALKHHHNKLYELQRMMKEEVRNIWDEEFKADSEETYISENFYFMDEKFRTIPQEVHNPGTSWTLEMLKE